MLFVEGEFFRLNRVNAILQVILYQSEIIEDISELVAILWLNLISLQQIHFEGNVVTLLADSLLTALTLCRSLTFQRLEELFV